MNKPVHLGLSILGISKIVLYEFWYDYDEPKYKEKARLCYMNTDSLIVYTKTEDIYEGIAGDVETRFDTSNYELVKLLPKRNGKKVIGLVKDALGGKIMTGLATLRPKTYRYLTDHNDENNKAKGTKSIS